MPKFVVVELADDVSTIDLLSYCVKRNFERVSLLQRLEDHPYLRDDTDVHDDGQGSSGIPMHSQFSLTDDERNRLLKLINGQGIVMDRVQMSHQSAPGSHMVQQHQMPSTSTFSNAPNNFMYQSLKSDAQYTTLKTEAQQQQQQQQQQQHFEATVNQVAHAQGVRLSDISGIEVFPLEAEQSPTQEVLRRKQPSRRAEESCKATCKVCGHDVMYSPQRTWNLMRHVWIMHQSPKPNQCSLCGYSHIKPYVRKHIEAQHKQQNATILDLKSPELESEWSNLLEQCFGVTYRKWKHMKEDNTGRVVTEDHNQSFRSDHFTHQPDVMANL